MNKIKLVYLERQEKIVADRERNVSIDKIAAKWGIGVKRVYQILQAAREAQPKPDSTAELQPAQAQPE